MIERAPIKNGCKRHIPRRKKPTWEKEPSEFPWHYDQQETCLILEGEVTVEAADQTVSFGPGDRVVFPQGLDCTWKVNRTVRKHYKFGSGNHRQPA